MLAAKVRKVLDIQVWVSVTYTFHEGKLISDMLVAEVSKI